jgi:ribosomal-protein-alanine N-acetyltransferase
MLCEKIMELKFRDCMIRSWKEEDASSILKYANNRKIWLNLRDGFPHPYTLDDAKQFITKSGAKDPETFFAIASSKEAIGSIGFGIGQDVHRYTAELAYWLAEPYWNKGIITEVIRIVTEYAFETFKLIRIYAEPYASNPASSKVLEKCGFQYEGRLKASVYKDGKVLDQLMYSKTKIT